MNDQALIDNPYKKINKKSHLENESSVLWHNTDKCDGEEKRNTKLLSAILLRKCVKFILRKCVHYAYAEVRQDSVSHNPNESVGKEEWTQSAIFIRECILGKCVNYAYAELRQYSVWSIMLIKALAKKNEKGSEKTFWVGVDVRHPRASVHPE